MTTDRRDSALSGVGASYDGNMGDKCDRRCLDCGYDLRGLTESRCPECGQPFSANNQPIGPWAFRGKERWLWAIKCCTLVLLTFGGLSLRVGRGPGRPDVAAVMLIVGAVPLLVLVAAACVCLKGLRSAEERATHGDQYLLGVFFAVGLIVSYLACAFWLM